MSLLHRDSNVRHSFRDVGYGISQVIPIVAQCFAFENVTLCIEQPELHIHPRLQAELADLFIAATLDSWESDAYSMDMDSENLRDIPNNQFIIETHSEHLLLRLQRRIREGVISNDDVSVLYVDSKADGTSTIQTLRLDTDGSFLDEWPGGFFEERFNEMFGA